MNKHKIRSQRHLKDLKPVFAIFNQNADEIRRGKEFSKFDKMFRWWRG